MALVATQNFRGVDRLLDRPAVPAAQQIAEMGRDAARMLLRYQVSEQNRWYFEHWETAQIMLGVLLLFIVFLGSAQDTPALTMALLMLILVVGQKFWLTPNIVALGRGLDFVPAAASAAERSRFWMYHGAYSTTEVVKWLLGLGLAARFVIRGRRGSGRAQRDIDSVDEPDHRHINR